MELNTKFEKINFLSIFNSFKLIALQLSLIVLNLNYLRKLQKKFKKNRLNKKIVKINFSLILIDLT